MRGYIKKNDDPPNTLTYEGTKYYLDCSNTGYFFQDCEGEGDEFISWAYVDDSEKKFLYIEQWSDTQFEAAVAEEIEEYQIMNILPPGK
ncbi:MAG: DUF4178 domain-containing protein [Nitrospinae bacterium]|nr:DUF4178 domain-containing protein [Nitrospinota bacterium]